MTFIEVLVTIAISTAVIGALMGIIQSFYRDNDYLIEETAALSNARSGVDAIISNLRDATYGDDGSYPIAAAGTSTLTIYADAGQGASVEKVQYTLVNGALYEYLTNSTGSPPTYIGTTSTSTIATNVRNTDASPIFTYYDSGGNQLSTTSTNIADISSVRVNVEIDLNPDRAPNLFTLSEMATLRNLEQH